MWRILMKIRCAFFGHDFEMFYTKYNNAKACAGLRCRHCGKMWWDK